MADRYEGETYIVDDPAPPPTAGQKAGAFGSAVLGTLALIALIAGGYWWATDLSEREAEALPVFRAGSVPVKTRPVDPGGSEAPYQQIESYEVATGSDPAAAGSALAPAPAEPAAEDVPMGELAAASTDPAADVDARPAVREPEAPRPDPLAVPEGEAEPPAAAETEEAPVTPPAATVAPTATAPIPQRRPATPPAAAQPATRTAAAQPATTEPAAASQRAAEPAPQPATTQPAPSLPAAGETTQLRVDREAQLATRAAVSRVQIQLGAFTDRAYTEAEWRRIAAANGDLLGGRALAIQQTVANGARYFRLRVGPFSSRDEARRVCQTLKSRGQDCIVANNG